MAAWRYENSLLVLQNVSLVRAVLYLLDLIHIDEIPNRVEKRISFSRVEKYFTP